MADIATATAPVRYHCACGNPVAGRSPHARICLECAARFAECPHCPSKAASEGLPACHRHLEAEIGITYRQLDYWARQGYLKPTRRANCTGGDATSGVTRVWPPVEVEIARRMARLIRARIEVATAAAFARESWPKGEIAPGITLTVTEARS